MRDGESDVSTTDETGITTVLADDLHITGTITFKSSLMIKGSLDGEIVSEGLLVVGPTAKVNAKVTTKNLVSHGEITGDVTASEQVVLKKNATHTGNITTPDIIVESRSIFNGTCIMRRGAIAESLPVSEEHPGLPEEGAVPAQDVISTKEKPEEHVEKGDEEGWPQAERGMLDEESSGSLKEPKKLF